jgi:mRNA interferase MazF
MATSEPYRLGDVVVVPFPYSDRASEKRRPALVVSNARLHALGYVWLAMITSAERDPARFDHAIEDLGAAGLSAPSIVRPTKIACVEPRRILRTAGRIAPEVVAAICDDVRSCLGADIPAAERPSA